MAQTVVELSGDERKLLTAYQKVRDAENQMDKGLKNIKGSARGAGRAAQGAGRQMQESFGAKAKNMLMSYAAGMGAVGAATTVIRGGFAELRKDVESTLAAVEKTKDAQRGLNQVLQGPEERQAYTKRQLQLGLAEGVPFEQIKQMQFARKSVEVSKEAITDLVKAVGANILTTEGGLEAAGKMPKIFEKEFETPINPRQALNAALVASQKSQMTFEQLSANIGKAVEGTAQMEKGTPVETLGVLSAFGDKFQPETAAQRINRFAATLARSPEFEDKTLLESYKTLREMPAEERAKYIGQSIQMSGAYTAFEKIGPEALEQRVASVQRAKETAGTPESELMRAVRDATDRSTLSGATNYWRRERNRAQQLVEAKALLDAPDVLKREAGSLKREAAERGEVDPFTRYLRGKVREGAKAMRAPQGVSDFAEGWMHLISGGPARTKAMDLLGRWTESIERQDEASRTQKEAAEDLRDVVREYGSETHRQREAAQGVPE